MEGIGPQADGQLECVDLGLDDGDGVLGAVDEALQLGEGLIKGAGERLAVVLQLGDLVHDFIVLTLEGVLELDFFSTRIAGRFHGFGRFTAFLVLL